MIALDREDERWCAPLCLARIDLRATRDEQLADTNRVVRRSFVHGMLALLVLHLDRYPQVEEHFDDVYAILSSGREQCPRRLQVFRMIRQARTDLVGIEP